jgi:DNA topoisomerase-6 subunit A
MSKILNKLIELGRGVLQDFEHRRVPKLKIPIRSTSNIKLDPKTMCYIIGKAMSSRSAGNIRHIKPFAQLLKVSAYCKDLIRDGKRHVTKRELYYISESWGDLLKFKEQPECDGIVEDIEAITGTPREDLRIIPKASGSVYGDLRLRFRNPQGRLKTVRCTDSADGQSIGPRTCEAEIVSCKADKVIAIETDGMYNRLMEENAHKKFNAILVNLGGQATRATRRFIKRLHEEKGLPVYIFTDSDPFGLHIAIVIMSGSARSAHINKILATPKATWLGVTATDITRYGLRTDALRDTDVKRIRELRKDPRYKNDKRLQHELREWLRLGKKAEQQALLRYGFRFVVDDYLPAKFRELKAPGFR